MEVTSHPSANLCVKSLMLKDNKASGPMRFARPEDGRDLQHMAKQLSDGEITADEVVLTTGFGLSDKGVPLRLPALFVPTLQLMERMKEIGLDSPRFVVYQARDFIIQTNNLSEQAALDNSALMESYLRRYIEVLHPSLIDHCDFNFNGLSEDGSNNIDSIVVDIRSRMTSGNPEITECMESLSDYRKANTSEEGSEYKYAAANILYNGAVEDKYPYAKLVGDDAKYILPVGGKKEKPFFRLTSAFNSADDSSSRKVIPLLSQAGESPTYYPAQAGDITSLSDLSSRGISKLSGPLRKDFKILSEDRGDIDNLASMYTHAKMKVAQGKVANKYRSQRRTDNLLHSTNDL